MVLQVKSLSIRFAVLFFFILAIIGWIAGRAPFVCCKRALLGAIIAYVVATLVIRFINYILVDAMLQEPTKTEEENGDERTGGK